MASSAFADPNTVIVASGPGMVSICRSKVPVQAATATSTIPSPEDERAPVESVEHHVVVTVEVDEQLYVVDFFAASPTADHLAALEPVLQTILRSAAFN